MEILASSPRLPDTSNDILFLFLGTGITLLLAIIGYVIGSINETFKWKRQHQFDAYRELLRVFGEHNIHLRKLIQFGDDPEYSRSLIIENIQKSGDRINATIATAQLAGSDKFSEKLNAYTTFVSDVALEVVYSTGKKWDLVEYNDIAGDLWLEVRFRAQRDLGIRQWWDRIDRPDKKVTL